MSAHIGIVEDDAIIRNHLQKFLEKHNYQVSACGTQHELLQLLEQKNLDVLLLDMHLPDSQGLEIVTLLKERWPRLHIIVMTAYATIEIAIDAVKRGAFEFLTKPFASLEVVALAVKRALNHAEVVQKLQQAQSKLQSEFGIDNLIGNSAAMQLVIKAIQDVAYSDATVLITGESGTGKELVARALHLQSPRKDQNFISCNCGAISESLLESELFGHIKGSFTGANADKKGILEVAHHGTLFLDEIGDMPLSTQVKLLRTLQNGEIKRVGDNRTIRVDVRVVAATNKNLEELIKQGLFRQDLYYRIHVIHIALPALRARMDDLEPLILHFVEKFKRKMKKPVEGLMPECFKALRRYTWPGNVRELENVIERAMVVTKHSQLQPEDLPASLLHDDTGSPTPAFASGSQDLLSRSYKEAKGIYVEAFNQLYLRGLLQKTDGNITKAASLAGMFRSNFKSLMRKSNISAVPEHGGDDDQGKS